MARYCLPEGSLSNCTFFKNFEDHSEKEAMFINSLKMLQNY